MPREDQNQSPNETEQKDDGNVGSPPEPPPGAGEWSPRDLEEAEPCPLPEVPDSNDRDDED